MNSDLEKKKKTLTKAHDFLAVDIEWYHKQIN